MATLKLACINVWGGRLLQPLLSYMKRIDADIYCLQEVLDCSIGWDALYCPDLLDRLKREFPDHDFFYTPEMDNFFYDLPIKKDVTCGSAIMVRKGIPMGKREEHAVFLERRGPPFAFRGVDQPRVVQALELPSLDFWLLNLHGLVIGLPFKGDSPKLLEQSARVRAVMQGRRVVLAGDFNVTANCMSMRMLDEGRRNLILEYGFKSTRNHYWVHPDKYSDYIIVPKDLDVTSFVVDNDEIADHLPLVMEFKT